MKRLTVLLLLAAGCAGRLPAPPRDLARFVPAGIDTSAPAMDALTAGLRARGGGLGLNGLDGRGEKVSRALVLLPHDRARAGVISFEIESGAYAGAYQCEALGRGDTAREPHEGWAAGLIGGATIYYAPQDRTDGATIPGVYALRNIRPDKYEIAVLGGADPATEAEFLAKVKNPDGQPKPFFSAVYRHWYNKGSDAVPVDLVWEPAYNKGPRVIERRPESSSPEAAARQAAQLAHNPRYYHGPYGRTGFAVHTDRWESDERRLDPRNAGRGELEDFRWRDTSGCVKLRPGCLLMLNRFIDEQTSLGRRPQLQVIETPLMDAVPQGAFLR